MKNEVMILIAEDDDGHAELIRRNLVRSGITNEIRRFKDGVETLDFILRRKPPEREAQKSYILILDIRMPKIDGIEVIKQLKSDRSTRRLPIIVLTTTDDPREIEKCHDFGCNTYIIKPIKYENFIEALRQLGQFLQIIEVPKLDGFSPT